MPIKITIDFFNIRQFPNLSLFESKSFIPKEEEPSEFVFWISRRRIYY